MHAFTLLAPVFLALSASSSPLLNTRQPQEVGSGSSIFRLIFNEHYCVLPASTDVLGCPVEDQLVGGAPGSNWTAYVESHSVQVVQVPAGSPFWIEHVSIDDELRNPVGSSSPNAVFGPGITRGYDYALN